MMRCQRLVPPLWLFLGASLLTATASDATASPPDSEVTGQGKAAVALVSYFGATAGALYSLGKANAELHIPGDAYQDLARRVAYEIDSGRAASALTRAPFDLTADLLASGAIVDPEPTTKVVAALGSYGARKFGEADTGAYLGCSKKSGPRMVMAAI
jgi:hypothetical protein